MMTLDPTILSDAEAARAQLLERQHELDRARVDLNHQIRRLHSAGGSMREISEKLGISHQRVHQIVTDEEAPADSLLRRLTDRFQRSIGGATTHFTAEARAAVARSREEALTCGARAVGPEHLLLALTTPVAGTSAHVLASVGIGHEELLTATREVTGVAEPRAKSAGHMPFAPATKKALELSLREALRCGDGEIDSKHVLLGLLRGADERIMAGLATTGVTVQAIREAAETRLPPD